MPPKQQVLERKFTKPTQISKHLYCVVCSEVFVDPLRLFCGHTYCKECIDKWRENHDSCPQCRSEIEQKLIGKDLLAFKIIQDFEVQCVNKLCMWKGRCEELNKHVRTCAYAKPPEWLLKLQSSVSFEDETKGDLALIDNDEFQERVNEEVREVSLAERLYSKSKDNQKLMNSKENLRRGNFKNIFENKEFFGKRGSLFLNTCPYYLLGVFNSKEKQKTNKKTKNLKSKASMDDYDAFFKLVESSDDDKDNNKADEDDNNSAPSSPANKVNESKSQDLSMTQLVESPFESTTKRSYKKLKSVESMTNSSAKKSPSTNKEISKRKKSKKREEDDEDFNPETPVKNAKRTRTRKQ